MIKNECQGIFFEVEYLFNSNGYDRGLKVFDDLLSYKDLVQNATLSFKAIPACSGDASFFVTVVLPVVQTVILTDFFSFLTEKLKTIVHKRKKDSDIDTSFVYMKTNGITLNISISKEHEIDHLKKIPNIIATIIDSGDCESNYIYDMSTEVLEKNRQ